MDKGTASISKKIQTIGYGTDGKGTEGKSLGRMEFEREAPKSNEVLLDILYCGVCDSDLHLLENSWGLTHYPCIPGHEIVGRVTFAGNDVTKFKIGDIVGVGNMVDSDLTCSACREGEENLCEGPHGPTLTQGGYLFSKGSDYNTFGGYSNNIVVREEFVLRIPEGMDPASAAPLLCSGTATYGPLKRFNIKPGERVGIIDIGGPGHIAVMLANAMGAEVTAITPDETKREVAFELGAKNVLISTNAEEMQKYSGYFHHILGTAPDSYDVTPYLGLLRRRGNITVMAMLGPFTGTLNNFSLASRGLSLAGSMIGSIAETQEVLNFCAEHGIRSRIELIKMEDINKAMERLKRSDVRFRFVIDSSSLQAS
ncbi:NAD(P)-dependent alcohol dehydrogenase [Terriglobus sp. ADX1]|uniref:NAD(P)-dependent alcohol dehydrogenase n=1 Tax=Terriglobus sp. ADX1 TaxID=2794063 RepID=UPI002FE6C48E